MSDPQPKVTWLRVMARLGLVVAVLLIVLLGAARVIGTTIGPGRMLAFMSSRDGDWDIYLMDTERRMPLNMTDELAIATPNPTQISGGIPPLGVLDQRYPSWSPDGRRLAFHGNPNGNWDLYIINSDGSGLERLTDNVADDAMPVWSPDGQRLMYHSNRNGDWDIYIYDLQSRTETRVTFFVGEDTFASWSPDGSRIVYTSNRDDDTEIYMRIGLDGAPPESNQYQLVTLTDNFVRDWAPVWSPDGQWLAYVTDQQGNEDVVIVRADGSQRWLLTAEPSNEKNPSWTPDGSAITLVSDVTGYDREQVFVVPFRDAAVPAAEWQPLTTDIYANWAPEWQPLPQDTPPADLLPAIQATPNYEATGTAYTIALTQYVVTVDAYWTAVANGTLVPPVTPTPAPYITAPFFPPPPLPSSPPLQPSPMPTATAYPTNTP